MNVNSGKFTVAAPRQHGGGGSDNTVEHAGCGDVDVNSGNSRWPHHGRHGGGGSDNAVEHAGCGGRRGRELWEIQVASTTGNAVVARTERRGDHDEHLSSEGSDAVDTLGVAGNVNVNWKFTVASLASDTAVAGATLSTRWMWRATWT